MKINVNGKDVDLIVNGDKPERLAKKVRLDDHGISADEMVRKVRDEKKRKDGQT